MFVAGQEGDSQVLCCAPSDLHHQARNATTGHNGRGVLRLRQKSRGGGPEGQEQAPASVEGEEGVRWQAAVLLRGRGGCLCSWR